MTAGRIPLFDRIFKPEHITLKNGHTIDRPRSRAPLITVTLLVVVFFCIRITGFNLSILQQRIYQMGIILTQIFRPDFTYITKVIQPLLDTVQMSLLGSFVGCLIALPLAIVADLPGGSLIETT